jgi:hypothetical protein
MEAPQSRMSGTSPDAIAFIRFCYGRRRVPWPELYDEMSTVAARGLFRGWTYPELAEHGIGFALPDLPRLAALVSTVTRADAQVQVLVHASDYPGEPTVAGSVGRATDVDDRREPVAGVRAMQVRSGTNRR